MNVQNDCIVWVHGISETQAGYSNEWRDALDPYMQVPGQNPLYTEVLWSDIFGENHPDVLNPAEQFIKTVISRVLPVTLTDIITDPDAYLNEVVLYLVRPDIHAAVNQKLKNALSTLSSCDTISIIAHSMGTVIAYETLQELVSEQPHFRLTNLFTLGSPLDRLRLFLGNNPGPKPTNITTWVNIYAQGDVIGSALSPDFQVNHDYGVPSFGGVDPHDSYFADGNALVLKDIIASTIINS